MNTPDYKVAKKFLFSAASEETITEQQEKNLKKKSSSMNCDINAIYMRFWQTYFSLHNSRNELLHFVGENKSVGCVVVCYILY